MAVFYFGTLPARSKLSNRYIENGDQLIKEKRFLSADLEYRKALVLKRSNDQAVTRRELARAASRDITKLKDFFREQSEISRLRALEEAKTVPASETEAVRMSRQLLDIGEYQLAIIPAETAIQMDKSYRDGWLYLGIANYETARNIELSDDIREYYIGESQRALERAGEIDPGYAPIASYLESIKS